MLKSNLLEHSSWVAGNNALIMTAPTVSGYSVFMPVTCCIWTSKPIFFKGITSNGTYWTVTYYNNDGAFTTSLGIDCYWLMIKS